MAPVAMQTELSSFLVEITALIFKKKDEDGKSYILDSIQDKTGMKGTGINPLNVLYTLQQHNWCHSVVCCQVAALLLTSMSAIHP